MDGEKRRHSKEDGSERHREERRRKHDKHGRSSKVDREETAQGDEPRHGHKRREKEESRRQEEKVNRSERDVEGHGGEEERRERHHHRSRRNRNDQDEEKDDGGKHRRDKRDQRGEENLESGEPKHKKGRKESRDTDKEQRDKRRKRRHEEDYGDEEEHFDYEDFEEEHHDGYHHVPDDHRYYGGKGGSGVILKEDVSDEYKVGTRYYADPKPQRPAREQRRDVEGGDKPTESAEAPKRKTTDTLMTRTGGAYIPPGKLRMMQASITDKSSAEYQRIAWEALKKSIHGHINKVNTSNIAVVARLLFKENIVRGRGLLCRSIIQAQAASPTFTNVYACLVSIINSKFPNIGELLLKRVVIRFKRAYKRNDKAVCLSAATFIAHLINQRVAHEILGLELLTLLVESPTDDSVEVAVSFLKEAGQKLGEVSSKGSNAIFDMLRNILHEGKLDMRIQYMIEVMFQVRKDGFQSFPSVTEELDLVDEEDQFTHLITFDDADDPQDMLNVFKMDADYISNEDKYKALRSEILDTDDDDDSGDDGDDSGDSDDDSDEDEETEEKKMMIIDQTETNLVALRKTIYLTIQSSLDFEECAHKLLKMDIKPGQEKELCHMFLDCCAEQRTYEKFFGLLAQRFCQVNQTYVAPFEQIFMDSYNTVHRLDTNKLRNVAKFFGHLLFTDAISWGVFSIIKLNEEDTTSSSRIFIKILFQELAEYKGLTSLNTRLKDPSLQEAMAGLFPRDDPKNTRFAINFFTSIGLGGLTDDLREHLKNIPKPIPISQLIQEVSSTSSEASSSSSEESSSDESSSEGSSSSEEEENRKKKKKQQEKKRKDEPAENKNRDRARPGRSNEGESSHSRDQNRMRGQQNRDRRTSEEDGSKRDRRRQRDHDEERPRRRQEDRSKDVRQDRHRESDQHVRAKKANSDNSRDKKRRARS